MKVQSINNYVVKPQNDFVFDANVWISLYAAVGQAENRRINNYNNFFKVVLMNKCNIYISLTILSEFINRYLRLEYEIYVEENNLKDFQFKKHFRETECYEESLITVKEIVEEKILSHVNLVDNVCNKDKLVLLFNKYVSCDFNDLLIADICQCNDMILVTSDKDFIHMSDFDIQIVLNL